MLPLPLVREAVDRGVSLMCATCDRYAEGRARGLPDDQCTAVGACVGPFGGGTFPQYKGPITDPERWCLRCGGSPVAAVRVVGTSQAYGLCRVHLRDASLLTPIGEETHHLLEIIRLNREVVVVSHIPKPRPFTRRSVAELLEEIDQELTERAGR